MHCLTIKPSGRIILYIDADEAAASAIPIVDILACQSAFSSSNAAGLIALASLRGHRSGWPADFSFWREFVDVFLSAFAHQSENESVPMPSTLSFSLSLQIPGTPGAEYASPALFTQ